ncbi:hypothetical protein JCM10450v2_006196 [Rhodotorula kratochvilovae]
MRDPRLSASPAQPSSSAPRRVHRDVLEPPLASTSAPAPAQAVYYGARMPTPPMEQFAPVRGQPQTQAQLQWAQQHEYYQRRQLPPQVQAPQTYLAPPPVAQHQHQHHQQAPPPVHRVYNVRCAMCDTFLSDRGMRAVLLLKPHIVLFSTDAAPSNAETFYPGEAGEEEQVERTCECLTSSINCHGCGKTVGYHIVSPCTKCNASVQKHQRSANHHRYVFHAGEVTARERSYYPFERGVLNPIVARAGSPSSSRGSSPAGRPTPPPAGTDKEPRGARAATPPRASGPPRLLQRGDTLYWHHLVPGGERAKSVDPRTRAPFFAERDGR